MTSLLKSKFDRSPRRAVFLSSDKLEVFHLQNGKLSSSYLFDVSEDGRKYFDRYLKETGQVATWLLVDLIEEEYRQDTIPHVSGGDRQALIERKRLRLFRETPYFYADIQGREEEGRKDDRVLFTGLTNPELITPWVNLLLENKTPLAGIYSVPRLTELLLGSLPDPADHMLVVNLQSISGLRQTFFLNKKLKISRLVGLPRYGTEPYAPIINEEVEIIRRYLNSMRMISIDKPLHIYYLGDAKLLGELQKLTNRTSSIIPYYVNIETLIDPRSGIRAHTPFCDQWLNYNLLKLRPKNYYARKEETRYYQMLRANRAMYIASVCMVLAGLAWGGLLFLTAIVNKQQAEIASKKAAFYSERYQVAKEKLPQTPVAPADLETVDEIATTLEKYRTSPFEMLTVISKGLDRFPGIEADEINWIASADPNTNVSESEAAAQPDQGVVGVSTIDAGEAGYAYYQIATFRGHIQPFDGNYRKALEMINEFAEALRALPAVHDVSIVTLPLDISSTASLQGAANSGPGQANFSVRLVLGIRHET